MSVDPHSASDRTEDTKLDPPVEPSSPPTRCTQGTDFQAPPTPEAKDPWDIPEQFGRYRILRKLGQGGMGAVYLALDSQLDRRVALKVPHFKAGDGALIERFKREARIAATLQHVNLCPIYDVGEVDGRHYLTMAYVEGRSLAELIKGGQPLPERPVVDLVRNLALALEEAHRKGVIHRDLKPANIMINDRNEPVILDFGLARRLQSAGTDADDLRLTAPGQILGTPSYMPPEQVRGDAVAMGPACDVYSLGVVLYELLTGQVPFRGPTLGALIGQVLMDVPPPPSSHRPDLDKALESVCLKALAKDPGRRFLSMTEFAAALGVFLNQEAVSPPFGLSGSTAVLESTAGGGLATQLIGQLRARLEASEARARRRPLWPWLVSGAAAVLAGLLVWVLFFRPQPQPTGPPTIIVHLTIQRLDPTVKFVLLGDKRIPLDQLNEPITLPAGEISVKLEHADGRVVDLGEVTLTQDDNEKSIELNEDNKLALLPRKEAPLDKKPVAELMEPRIPLQGTNVPALANGIYLIDGPAQFDDGRWAVSNLVGIPGQGEYCAPSNSPLAVVVGFPPGRLARISALGVNPTTAEENRSWVREVQLEVSDTYSFTGFRTVGRLKVPPIPNDAVLSLSQPETARYVRFTFLSNGGGGYMQLNKVLVMGSLVHDDAVPVLPLVNVALAMNGGKVKHFTSEFDQSGWKAANLIDGNPGLGWCSSGAETASSVTIELGRPSVVRHVAINNYSRESVDHHVREAEVLLSETGKEGDFRPAGKLQMEPLGRDWSLDLKTPTKARFVKVLFLKNGGGGYMQAHEIKVFAEPEVDDFEVRCAALFDANAAARKKAAEALKKSGDRRAVPVLVQRVADERADIPDVGDKTAALGALIVLAPDQVGKALLEAWRVNRTAEFRAWVAQMIGNHKQQLSGEDLRQATESLAERVADAQADGIAFGDKTAALKTLQMLDPEQAKGALDRARKSSNRQVADWANKQK